WLEPPDDRYLMLRDPDIRYDQGKHKGKEHGLLRCACVHESVIARINTGTVRYAPIALPESFEIHPPQREGETVAQADSESGETVAQVYSGASTAEAATTRAPQPLVGPEIRARLQASAETRFTCQENLWN